MMKRAFPHGEDHAGTAGGDTSEILKPRAIPIQGDVGDFREPGAPPPGEGSGGYAEPVENDELENEASRDAGELVGTDGQTDVPDVDFLIMAREAEHQASQFMQQVNRKAWSQSLRAIHNEHFAGSKYTTPDWRHRSHIFRPKTRSAMRKDQAAVASSLFGNLDAINCLPGNESDPTQRGAAAVMEELINYRTDRTSGRAAIPWFPIAMGARQDSLTLGICLSKQTWKLDLRKESKSQMGVGDDGQPVKQVTETWFPHIDRPNIDLIPGENFTIDPAADWTDPAQSAAYVIIRWPMQLDDVKTKMDSPINPWNKVEDSLLMTAIEEGNEAAAIRSARESGLDRMKHANQGNTFRIIWVWEVYMRVGATDYTFFSVGDKAFLTDPKPVSDVYPEQGGDRPLVLGYGTLEAHRIFPMSSVESWQMMQAEINDLINLSLDAIKQNVMPVSKVRRGRQIDLDQVKKRGSGSSIMVSQPDDVTWERPPDIPQSVPMFMRDIELEMDDLAGQFNAQSVEHNNAVSRTLGGLKLVSGSASAVQEMDIRVWIETWVNPVLAQVVRLEQWFEHDPIILGLCGERAQLMQKHGINQISDELMDQEVTIRVNVGLGAGDPQQRLARFQAAAAIALPILQQSKKFMSGELEMDEDAIMDEVFGAAGYRDGGKRFIRKGQPQGQDPLMDLKAQEIKSKISKNDRTGRSSLMSGLAAIAKVALGQREAESEQSMRLLDHDLSRQQFHADERNTGFDHGLQVAQHHAGRQDAQHQQGMAERGADASDRDTGFAHGMQVVGHQADQQNQADDRAMSAATALAKPSASGAAPPSGAEPETPAQPPLPPEPQQQGQPSAVMAEPPPKPVRYNFIREGGVIVAAVPVYADQQPAAPAGPGMQFPPPGM